jgi:hypothetical protein
MGDPHNKELKEDPTMTTKAIPVPLGRPFLSRGVAELMGQDLAFSEYVLSCFRRHVNGDWGEVDEEDQRTNDHALVHGYRLLSAYTDPRYTGHGQSSLWIITEADRATTTVLFPDEY